MQDKDYSVQRKNFQIPSYDGQVAYPGNSRYYATKDSANLLPRK
jgi:hypothetical protein